jgi:outer membrane protein
MRSFRLFIGVIGLSIIAGVAAQAAELTLDDCISLALKNRESIIRARGAEDLAAAGKQSALGAFLPQVDASYNWSKSKTTDIKASIAGAPEMSFDDQDNTSKSLTISGNMNLLNFSTFFDYAAARADHAAARLDVIASEQDLIYAVKTAYFAYLAANENVSALAEAAKRSEEQLKLIQSKFELGSASKSDVLKQKVQYGNDKLELLRARNGVTTTAANLAYTVGVDPRENWQFSDKYSSRAFDGSLDSAVAFGLTHRPALLSLEKTVSAAGSSLGSVRAGYLPKLGGFASYSISDGTRGDTLVYNSSSKTTAYGFRASWNIFDGFLRERNVTSAKVNRNNLQAALADARNLAISNIKTAYLDIERLKEQKMVAEENVTAANEDLKITQEKYNLGAATILDLLNAQVSLKQAEVSRIRADFDLNLAMSKLEQSMGKL